MRVAGAAEPDVGLRVRGLRLDLREDLARAFLRHRDLDPALPRELVGDRLAPLELHAAVHVQAALPGGARCVSEHGHGHERCDRGPPDTSRHHGPPARIARRISYPTGRSWEDTRPERP